MGLWIGLLLVFMVAFGAANAQAGDTLSGVREEVRSPRSDSSGDRKADGDDCNWFDHVTVSYGDGDGAEEDNLIADAIVLGATSPFWGPPAMLGDNYSDVAGFPEYPYKHGHGGWMQIEPCYATQQGKPFMLRTRGEYGNTFKGVERVGGQFLFDHASRWGLDTEFNFWTEHRGARIADELWTGDFNLVFRFAQSERIQMRTGLGVNWLNDNLGAEGGLNFTYGLDYFPIDPFVVTAEFDGGGIGDGGLVHVRSTVGVHYHRFEIYTGFDHFKIGDVELNSLVAGVRLWL